ncbi:MAG: four helix bundle protein [Flavobacteriales bacterium]|nr:MAG: four helix bundle protein [Flavobacteriales bacterium]
MATIEKFEDIKSWQKARDLCKSINTLTNKSEFARDWSLKDQIKRSSGSSMDNIAEGFDRNSTKEFRQYLFISKASTSEVKSQLYRALDQEYITKDEFNKAFVLATDVSKLIGGLLNYLKDKNIRKIN